MVKDIVCSFCGKTITDNDYEEMTGTGEIMCFDCQETESAFLDEVEQELTLAEYLRGDW